MKDLAAENSVLSTLFNYGRNVYVEICDLLEPATFSELNNQILFTCLKHIFEKMEVESPDIGSLYSAAKDLGFEHKFKDRRCEDHISQVISFDADPKNAKEFAKRIKRLEIARTIKGESEKILEKLDCVTGQESLSEIISIPEDIVFNLSNSLTKGLDTDPVALKDVLDEYITEKLENPVDQVGISTSFSRFDEAIGGGLRPGTVTVIGARAKNFKSGVALTMGNHIASLDIPALYLDTELQEHEQAPRLLAKHSNTNIGNVETGKFDEQVLRAAKERVSPKLFHKNISGMHFSEQVSLMRRWLFKQVGVDLNGKSKPAVIIYDYLKLMESSGLKDLAEYQAIGFLLTELHNFAVKYNIPILTFVQLNRDGINREDSAAIAQSDRILWYCSSFSILKRKSKDEMDMERNDGIPEELIGNYKLIPTDCRHGAGIQDDDYVSLGIVGDRFQITEVGLYSELKPSESKNNVSADEISGQINF